MDTRFPGFWRGIVVNNDDSATETPYRGKIQVLVPEVYGRGTPNEDLPWAEPCFPVCGGGRRDGTISSGIFGLPAIGSTVWIGFEQGSPQNPIWFGTWFGGKDVSKDDPYELGEEGRENYPNTLLIKPPQNPLPEGEEQSPGMWIRFVNGEKVEIVYSKSRNYISIDGIQKKILVVATGFDVEIQATPVDDVGGQITLRGDVVSIEGRRVVIEADESIRASSDGDAQYSAVGTNLFSSRSAIRGSALSASGFEDH